MFAAAGEGSPLAVSSSLAATKGWWLIADSTVPDPEMA